MSLTTNLDGFTVTAIALAVLLSALVSLIGSSARRQAVVMAEAGPRDLCELTGILNPKELQDIFGPPNLNRIWQNLTLERVMAERRPLGHVISGQAVDWACVAAGLLAFFSSFFLIEIGLLIAFGVQVTGWIYAAKLPK